VIGLGAVVYLSKGADADSIDDAIEQVVAEGLALASGR
jgi:ActR/RegA family two-component response regulator